MPEEKTMCLQKEGVYGLPTDITAGSCEQGNDLRDFTKVTDIVDYSKDYKLLKKESSTEIIFRIKCSGILRCFEFEVILK